MRIVIVGSQKSGNVWLKCLLANAYDLCVLSSEAEKPERPWLDVRLPSLQEPGWAPDGKHVMSVSVHGTPYALGDGGWSQAARDTVGDRVARQLEEHAPGFATLVRKRLVLVPPDLEAQYGLPEGNAYDGELALDQLLFMRPVPDCSAYATPVHGLFLCSSGSHPGGMIAGAAGANAARAMRRSS